MDKETRRLIKAVENILGLLLSLTEAQARLWEREIDELIEALSAIKAKGG